MALWNWNGEMGDKTFINLKLVSTPWPVEKEDAPKFVRLDSDFKETDERYTSLSGKLIKFKSSFTPKKGARWDIYGFKAIFDAMDNENIYVLESTLTNASKDLLNGLLLYSGEEVEAKIYLNKNGYPSAVVKDAGGNHTSQFADYTKLGKKDWVPLTDLYDEVVRLEEEASARKEANAEANVEVDDKEELTVEDMPF